MSEKYTMKILILDPDPEYFSGFIKKMSDMGHCAIAREFFKDHRAKLEEMIFEEGPDIVIVNLDVDGDENFGALVNEIYEIPLSLPPRVLGISSRPELAFKELAYQSGVSDYLVKPVLLPELVWKVEMLLRYRTLERDLSRSAHKLNLLNVKLSEANEKLAELSLTDELTGLRNMRYMFAFLERQFAVFKRHPHPLCLIMIDLDHFKAVNDENSHLVGSEVIKMVGMVVDKAFRESDVKARYGGDEFIVALPYTEKEGAIHVAERLRTAIREDLESHSAEAVRKVTASIGVAEYDPVRHPSFTDLIRDADHALYEAKEAGRDQVCIFKSPVL